MVVVELYSVQNRIANSRLANSVRCETVTRHPHSPLACPSSVRENVGVKHFNPKMHIQVVSFFFIKVDRSASAYFGRCGVFISENRQFHINIDTVVKLKNCSRNSGQRSSSMVHSVMQWDCLKSTFVYHKLESSIVKFTLCPSNRFQYTLKDIRK